MNQDELKALVATEMRQSLGYSSSKLSQARQKAEYYYLGLPIGDLAPPEVDGRSSVVSTDVRDTVESMLPQLMVTFCGGDKVVSFEATKPGEERNAEIATEYLNYLFFKRNDGHKIVYTWFKDALVQKNGIVKVWWDDRSEGEKEEYTGLSDVELAGLMDDDELEIIDQKSYPDEEDVEARQKALDQIGKQLAKASEAAQAGNAQAFQAAMQMQGQIDQINQTPVKMLFDVSFKRTSIGKLTIDNVPPEEFLISRNAKDIATAKFVGHRVQRTASELKSLGYKNVDKISGEDQGQAVNSERIQRLSWNDENAYISDDISTDESQRRIWVTEAYIRCDYDGDGISELRKVTVAGDQILDNEEIDVCPLVSITPVPLPHTFFGLSIADLALESQRTKTSVLRAQLDNLYLTINGRHFAVEGQVNLDDLLTSRPGGVVRVKQPGAVGPLSTTSGDVGYSASVMEYLQQDLENRTGWTRYSQGNDSDGLNHTATGVNVITNRADMRLDLVARNFADGFAGLMKLMLRIVCQKQQKEDQVSLTGGWLNVTPSEWRNQFDVTINVGIGIGNKDQKVQHLMALIAQQQTSFPLGVSNAKNVYESHAELAKLLGYKDTSRFFTDPTVNPPPPKPDPEQMKAQSQMQIKQAEIQANGQIEQMRLSFQAQAEEAKRNHEAQIAQMQARLQAEVDANRQNVEAQQQALKIGHEAELEKLKQFYQEQQHLRDKEFEGWKAKLQSDTSILIAQIQANSKTEALSMQAAEAQANRSIQFEQKP